MATHATHAPIQANFGPIVLTKDPIAPRRVPFPIPNSRMRSGTDHSSRNTAHATRKLPPPFEAAMRGKRQMFPVPMAMPSIASSIPQREVKTSDRVDTVGGSWLGVRSGCGARPTDTLSRATARRQRRGQGAAPSRSRIQPAT